MCRTMRWATFYVHRRLTSIPKRGIRSFTLFFYSQVVIFILTLDISFMHLAWTVYA